MLKSTLTFIIVSLLTIHLSDAQDLKFGKVSKKELEEKYYPSDSSANAAILYKKRRTTFEYSANEGWVLITKIHERIKIYNKEGYDWATKKISLYKDGEDEKVSIKAYTFNLVGNKIEKIKLKNDEIFDEDVNKYWGRKKFTMPNLTENSIVEWEYTIRSPYYSRIDDMEFQYRIPVKYIDTQVTTPEYFVFKTQPQGYYPININQSKKPSTIIINSKSRAIGDGKTPSRTTFSQDKIDFMSNVTQCVVNDIPALKEEPYTNNINNYKTLLKFEISAYKPQNGIPKFYNTTWEDVTKTIYDSPNFGIQLNRSSFFKDDLETLVNSSTGANEKVIKIFQFVKNKIKWDNYRGKYTDKGIRRAYNDGIGNVAEINLTLVAMLREAGITANPVLVSTRDNGIPLAPTTEGFNYVIAGVELNNELFLLDATEKYSLPNVLPLRDLNWQGRMVYEDGKSKSVNLFPNTFSSKKAFLSIKLNSDGLIEGFSRNAYSNLIALNYRNNYNSVADQDLIGKFEKDNQNIEITDFKVVNDEEIDKPLSYTMAFESDNQVEKIGDKMYFSPLVHLAKKENPFKLEERSYPVDFGAPWEERYTISIEIPEGYQVESLPESAGYSLPDNLGFYKFVCQIKGTEIQVLSIAQIGTAIVSSPYYQALKEFYKEMIDKQLEKVVLSKS
tara:strand:+ start:219361 stop:221376 length:2016 start_codon:yes stop_codon:yes gene_type:complete